VRVKDSVVYISDLRHLWAFDISDPENPIELDFLKDAGGLGLDIDGDYLYALTHRTFGVNPKSPQLSVVDISNPGELKLAGYYHLPYAGEDIIVRNNIAIATCEPAGIYFIKFDEPTSVNHAEEIPLEFQLSQNYPNPFNPETTIEYSLPVSSWQSAVGSVQRTDDGIQKTEYRRQNQSLSNQHQVSVSLKVYDILGREVATLVNTKQKPGNYTVNFDAGHLSSGVYFYMLQANNYVKTRKMVLIK
jgi:hypothetical protein